MTEQAAKSTETMTQDGVERWLLEVCRDLGLQLGGAAADFFEAGGTSLTAIKLITRAEQRFGEDALPPDDLFTESTVRQIAASIRRHSRRAGAPDEA